MKKRITAFILTVFVMCSLFGFSYAKVIMQDDDTIVIDVLINNYDEEYIKNIELDDGTVIGDHEYVINFVGADLQSDDPSEGSWGGYFNYAAWINRDGLITLSLDPVSTVRASWSKAEAAWTALESSSLAASSNWKNSTCMYWQYKCHFNYANDKTYWNIEPSRNAASYAAVVLGRCNP